MHHEKPIAEQYQFSDRAKKITLYMIGLGVLGMVLAFFIYPENHHSRFWSNLLLNGYYFAGIAVFGLFFAAAHQIGYSGWHTLIKRLMESFSAYVPYMFGVIILILIGLVFDWHNLYHHWTHPAPGDTIVAEKLVFLNKPFFIIRVSIYMGLWTLFAWLLRKVSLQEDTGDMLTVYKKNKRIAAIFLVIFAVSSSMISWDLIMSLDPHWYSTLFGWFNFASYMVASIAFMILFAIYLKSRGYLQAVNENHIHDLGKYMFAASIFWTYLWFSQYMLIWYGNIPEDTAYFIKRFDIPFFKIIFFLTLFINFVVPLLVLMTRKSKRNYNTIAFMSLLLIGGHYLDFYGMVMPEPNMVTEQKEHHEDEGHHSNVDLQTEKWKTTLVSEKQSHNEKVTEDHAEDGHHAPIKAKKTYAGLGLVELLIFIGFAGGFLHVVLRTLSKNPLIPVNHPYIEESIHHHI